jgi:hypothetical protein
MTKFVNLKWSNPLRNSCDFFQIHVAQIMSIIPLRVGAQDGYKISFLSGAKSVKLEQFY